MAITANGGTGIYDEAFISTGDLLRSDGLLFGRYFRKYNEGKFLDFLESNQNWKVLKDTLATWHEKGYILNNAEVESFTGGAAPDAVAVITLEEASHSEGGARSPFNVDSSIKVGNTHMLVHAKDESVDDAHTITVKPWDATVQLDAILATGQTLVPVSKFSAENTGYNEAASNLPTKFSEQAGIMKLKKTITGTQATNARKVSDENGNFYVTNEADFELFMEHKLDIAYAMLLGPGGTTVNAAGESVRAMKGYIPQIEERGNEYTYNQTVTLSDVDNWTRILTKEQGSEENMMNEGHESCIVLENLMTDVMKSGARVYLESKSKGMGGAAGKDRMIDFGFDGFFKNNFMFYRNQMHELNNPINTYAADQPYSWYNVITPYKVVKDAKTGEKGFSLSIGYKAAPGPHGNNFDRKFQFRKGGDSATGGNHDSEIDNLNMRYLTEAAAVLVCANQSIISKKS